MSRRRWPPFAAVMVSSHDAYGKFITAITKGATTDVTFGGPHGFSHGQLIRFDNVAGMTQLNYLAGLAGPLFFVNLNDLSPADRATKIRLYSYPELLPLNSSGYGTYTSGGSARNLDQTKPEWQNIIYAARSRSATSRFFAVDGVGRILLGVPTAQKRIQVDTTTDRLEVLNTQLNASLFSLDNAGILATTGGIQPGVGGAVLKRILTLYQAVDFPSIAANGGANVVPIPLSGAVVGDEVTVTHTGDRANAGLSFFGAVTIANEVKVYCRNHTAGAIDPGPQTLRITVRQY